VNECMTVHIEGERARVTVMQIAGVVARRIVCRVSEGDKLEAGQRFGMIRFGSRTDCYMPHGTLVRVQPGEKVVGGMTIIGELA
jgi:phosphatidylserine decarboxylase